MGTTAQLGGVVQVAVGNDRDQRGLGPLAALEQPLGEVNALAQLGDLNIDRADTGVQQLGAVIIEEVVGAGASAKSADRSDLMRMVKYVKQHKVSYCVVHKVDRLARNRLEDVDIHRHLINAGVHLVSATENIDETPSGMLFHASCRRLRGSTPATSPPKPPREE